jgi:hypothetical protein
MRSFIQFPEGSIGFYLDWRSQEVPVIRCAPRACALSHWPAVGAFVARAKGETTTP